MKRLKPHGIEPSATEGRALVTTGGKTVWGDGAAKRVVLLEVGQTAANVPAGTFVGAIVFRKAV